MTLFSLQGLLMVPCFLWKGSAAWPFLWSPGLLVLLFARAGGGNLASEPKKGGWWLPALGGQLGSSTSPLRVAGFPPGCDMCEEQHVMEGKGISFVVGVQRRRLTFSEI